MNTEIKNKLEGIALHLDFLLKTTSHLQEKETLFEVSNFIAYRFDKITEVLSDLNRLVLLMETEIVESQENPFDVDAKEDFKTKILDEIEEANFRYKIEASDFATLDWNRNGDHEIMVSLEVDEYEMENKIREAVKDILTDFFDRELTTGAAE